MTSPRVMGGRRTCPTGCGRTVTVGHLLCRPYWAQVPAELRRDVHRTWTRLQRGELSAVDAYETARDAAIGAVS